MPFGSFPHSKYIEIQQRREICGEYNLVSLDLKKLQVLRQS